MKHTSLSYILAAAVVTVLFAMSTLSDNVKADTRAMPVVVELFTSQGCSSCPPADKILGELSEDDDVIALSLPVDYWDNLGWRDTFASPDHTQRQRDYASMLGTRRVYTPQMVINGRIDVVGSRRTEVMTHLANERAADRETVDISMRADDDKLIISLTDLPTGMIPTQANVWIVPYHQGRHEVAIKRGENRGKTIAYSNVVDGLKKIGSYNGSAKDFVHALAPLQNKSVDGCAVIVQDRRTGEIIGAQRIDVGASG